MRKIIVNENRKGLLFKNGRYVKTLGAGKYMLFGGREIDLLYTDREILSTKATLDVLLKDEDFKKQVDIVELSDEKVALHFVNDRLEGVLLSGKHAFWKDWGEHKFTVIDTTEPEIKDVPAHFFDKIPQSLYTRVEVAEYQKARLYFDRRLVRILDAGVYCFWNTPVKVEAETVDTRLTQMDVVGQEVLTLDKVTLRINLVLNYKITDWVRILTEIDDFKEQLHVTAQLALRDFVGANKLDDVLEGRDKMSDFILDRLKDAARGLYVEIKSAGVKDIILPGEVRDIMNTVLVAEKRAQANVITRREEVASTRSLLNTARLMDENRTLYKLKELEYVERICENVGTINLGGSGDILTRLTEVLKRE